MVDVAAVPDRLEDPVAEPEDQEVPDRLLAEVVIDPVDLRLAEDLADLAVEPDRRVEVVAERLLDDDPPPAALVPLVVEPDPAQLGDDLGELPTAGSRGSRGGCRGCSARGRSPRGVLASRSKPAASAKSQRSVADPRRERPPGGLVERQDPRVLLERRPVLGPEGRRRRTRAGRCARSDELVRQEVRPPQLVQRRNDLAVGEVAGRPEQDEDARVRDALEAEALAERVVLWLCGRLRRVAARQAQVAHRPRRVLRPRRGIAAACPAPVSGRDGRAPARQARSPARPAFRARRAVASESQLPVTRSSPRGRRTRCAARRGPSRRTSRPGATGSASAATA